MRNPKGTDIESTEGLLNRGAFSTRINFRLPPIENTETQEL